MNDTYTDNETGKLNTQGMLEDAFISGLKKGPKSKVTQASKTEMPIAEKAPNYNTEDLLVNLYNVRDGLIEAFTEMGINKSSKVMTHNINLLGECIKSIGGQVDGFDPFSHVSGLQAPSLMKNAKRVIENTQEAYSLGNITDLDNKEDGKVVIMAFNGQKDDIAYKAVGTIEAPKCWIGNEAIDYIYTPGEGRMSVKALNEEGKWIDKSANYKISWELSENEIDLNASVKNIKPKEAGNVNKPVEIKEEVKKDALNNIDDEIGDFPIEDKT